MSKSKLKPKLTVIFFVMALMAFGCNNENIVEPGKTGELSVTTLDNSSPFAGRYNPGYYPAGGEITINSNGHVHGNIDYEIWFWTEHTGSGKAAFNGLVEDNGSITVTVNVHERYFYPENTHVSYTYVDSGNVTLNNSSLFFTGIRTKDNSSYSVTWNWSRIGS